MWPALFPPTLNVSAPAVIQTLWLQMKYDDGFVAWLNGVEIACRNAPATLAYNSTATADRSKSAAMTYEVIQIPISAGMLKTGSNILAIQGLAYDKSGSEFIVMPQLLQLQYTPNSYMLAPTPRDRREPPPHQRRSHTPTPSRGGRQRHNRR